MSDVDNSTAKSVMPELVGMGMDRALRLMELAGIRSPQIRLVPNTGRRGEVVSQEPSAGVTVTEASPARLLIEEDNPIRVLPEVFQEEDKSELDATGGERRAGMLHDFLYVPQQIMTGLGRMVESMHRQLTPEGASPSFLPWMSDLLPMEFDAGWDPEQVRAVLREAPELLERRGTASGLEDMIKLYTGIDVKVRENGWPHTGVCVGVARVGQAAVVSTIPRSEDAFFVELPAGVEISRAQIEGILRITDAEKPVHLRSCVVRSSEPPELVVEGDAVGEKFIVGVSRVAGPVVTPPARWGACGPVTMSSKTGGESEDSSVEVSEENAR